MNVNDIYKSGNTLKAEDLKGHTVKVTIENYELKKFEDGAKLILSFAGKEKGLVCNKTNAMIIQSAYGPDTDGWLGKTIEIYPDKTTFGGKLVDCLRVRVPAPAATDQDIPW